MKRFFFAALLCLSLAACGQADRAAAPLGDAAGLDGSEILLCIDGQEIPAWKYLYWLAEDCRRLEEQCAAAGAPLDWELSLPEGGTLEASVKAGALSDTALYAAVDRWASAYGCTLTDEERAALPEQVYDRLTEAQGQALTETGYQYFKLYKLYITEGSPLAPTAETLAQFAENTGFLSADRLLIPTNGNRDAARQTADALFAQLNAAQDPAAVFDTLLSEYAGTDPVADWPEALRSAAAALETGQISGIIEADGNFSILRRLPTDEAALREAHFDSLLLDAARSSEIQYTAAYEALRPSTFWAALKEVDRTGRR